MSLLASAVHTFKGHTSSCAVTHCRCLCRCLLASAATHHRRLGILSKNVLLSVPRGVAELAFRIDLWVVKLREILAVKVLVVQNNSDENHVVA